MNDENSTPIRAHLIGQFLAVDHASTQLSTTGPSAIKMAAVMLLRQGCKPDQQLLISTTLKDAMRSSYE
jgi:hypothetical protein